MSKHGPLKNLEEHWTAQPSRHGIMVHVEMRTVQGWAMLTHLFAWRDDHRWPGRLLTMRALLLERLERGKIVP